jgi:hypothetical protein
MKSRSARLPTDCRRARNPRYFAEKKNDSLPGSLDMLILKTAGPIQIYRSFLTPDIGSKLTSMLEPRDVLALARLLDKLGDAAGAREQYRRVLDLWKQADPGQPELAAARRKAG